MVRITEAQLDTAAAAYYRSTGTSVNRAGLRAAIHTINQLTDEETKLLNEALYFVSKYFEDDGDKAAKLIRSLVGR